MLYGSHNAESIFCFLNNMDFLSCILQALAVVGVIPGCDLTPEAALAKISYVLSKTHLSLQQKKQVKPGDLDFPKLLHHLNTWCDLCLHLPMVSTSTSKRAQTEQC